MKTKEKTTGQEFEDFLEFASNPNVNQKKKSIKKKKKVEYRHIVIPPSEIRKKLLSLNILEEQYADFLINKYENGGFYKPMCEDGVIIESTREDIFKSIDKSVKWAYYPTNEELQKDAEYIEKLRKDGCTIDFQEILSEMSSFKGLFS